jgi:WD40 repeat protein
MFADDNLPLISPSVSESSSSSYHSYFDGEDATSGRLPNEENAKEIGHLEGEGSQRKAMGPTLHGIVEPNSNSTAPLNLNLMHKLTLEGEKRVAFSMDGKYLATASSSGVVSIFDMRTGKRIRQVPLHFSLLDPDGMRCQCDERPIS